MELHVRASLNVITSTRLRVPRKIVDYTEYYPKNEKKSS